MDAVEVPSSAPGVTGVAESDVAASDAAASDAAATDPANGSRRAASETSQAPSSIYAWPPDYVLWAVAAGIVGIGLVLRFWTNSDLWLDEALTVNIASRPLSQLHSLLLHDGAPPLYYVLLHGWMKVFGSSDLGARSLSGVASVATIPFVWVAARRLGGKTTAVAAVALVVTSPFAVRYATEARMYSLVALLTAMGAVALQRALERPRAGNLVATGLCMASLLYTHYWALYLGAIVGCWLVWRAWRGSGPTRVNSIKTLVALGIGDLFFLPWLPTFLYQAKHTGTPWAAPASFAALVDAISSFAGGATSTGRALALMYFGLVGLGLFGIAKGPLHIDIDLRTRPRARPLAVVAVGTLAAAVVGGYAARSTFQARYAMVVFVPIVLLVALGLATFADRRIRAVVLGAAVLFGLAGGASDVTTNRTQAYQVAAALAAQGRPGDVVAFCPDQLGPDASRLIPAGRYQEITFPRDTPPQIVDWVDYAAHTRAASPSAFAAKLASMAGRDHRIWYVWMGGYQTYGTKCEQIANAVTTATGQGAYSIVSARPKQFFEPMGLLRFGPPG